MIFNNETSIILSKRLKELREERGISQETLLEQLNSAGIKISLISLKNYEVTEQHHSKFLAVNGMNTEFLFNIAEFYGVSIDYLLGRTDTRSPNPDIQSACEYTGLSEKSIEKLKRINHFNADGSENPDKSFIDILDRFIQSKYFSELIVYWESLHTHSTEWKEKEMKTNEDYIYKGQLNQSCDIARYNVSRMIEKISDEFDRRENDEHNSKQK